uniref:HAUS augmin-like complex subunit 7 n=1 Tax=Haemonchus placei TaxID=6290 RepID=A0A0N4W9Z8_HAEPC
LVLLVLSVPHRTSSQYVFKVLDAITSNGPVQVSDNLSWTPIYDKTENTFSQEELLKLCEETKSIGQKFGINNVSSFAGSNCALIRLYYPDVTCEQINVFLQYCQASGSI